MQFENLPENHIRLLKPTGFITKTQQIPSFTLTTVSIDDKPRYSALSYVWGSSNSNSNSDSTTYKISLNHELVCVRQNLYHFCFQLTREFEEFGAPDIWDYIWIDAVCINQNDITERNRQVAMMDKIYSSAAVVIVWLGRLNKPSEIGMGQISGEEREVELQRRRESVMMNGCLDLPYWTRRWTIQEFILAKQIHFFCVNDLGQSLDWMYDELLSQIPKLYLGFGRGGAHSFVLELFEKHDAGGVGSTSSLLDLLLEFDECECQDPRDKVFALLSLVDPSEKAILSTFFPDYSLNHESVVIITLSILQRLKGIPILGWYQSEEAERMSEKYSTKWHAPWPEAILFSLGVAAKGTDDVKKWQDATDCFDIECASKEIQRTRTYQKPYLL